MPQALELAFRIRRQTAGPVSDFDLVSGLSGLVAYLLCRRTQQEIAVALREVTRTLVELATEAPVPRWHTPAHFLADVATRQLYPSGSLNCGLAHGIPGPLAALSLVCKAGVRVEGMPEAINRMASWLVSHRTDDEWGPNWPTAFPLFATSESGAELNEQSSRAPATSRTAWCYGRPRHLRALWLAGETLDNHSYQQLATGSASRGVSKAASRETNRFTDLLPRSGRDYCKSPGVSTMIHALPNLPRLRSR